MRIAEVEKFIKDAVKGLIETDDGTFYRLNIDSDFTIYVGWEDGFDKDDETCYHSQSEPTYCICAKVAENNYALDFGDAYMPWYEDGEVYDTDCSIGKDTDIHKFAKWLLEDYRDMKKLLKKGEISFGE